ncbi:septin-12 isoform X4 [Sapajus apella]|uniref:Septin-12 isoform X4 n=1 Tax=Sapajus apella TaxID=9515 RepID=A0A6J3G891_SAPAP|nr:septin-12 isoform X4 [Sapajus apella]
MMCGGGWPAAKLKLGFRSEVSVGSSEPQRPPSPHPPGDRHLEPSAPMDPLRRSPSPCSSSRPSSPSTPPCEMLGPVGIEAVLDQLKIKAMKMGFEFNIMVVGQSGLGKSTMVNTLFKSKVWKSNPPGLGVPTPQTLQLHSVTHVIEEKGVKLKLTVTDTPGFGDQINNDKWEDHPEDAAERDGAPRAQHTSEGRVHLPPQLGPHPGLHQRAVRAVPAGGDPHHPPAPHPRHPRALLCVLRTTHWALDRIPFAVVGADREHLVDGRCVLGRKTKWGIIEVENMAHCEFPLLRDLLIRSHLQDLKDITHNVHYENYRVIRLNESHLLPRGPGWVNLAPASPGQLTSPRPFKVCRGAHDDSEDEF